ncbi:hypothetical protein [Sediminihabitans luteus]|nr:hypothetical protein [Sediminihabitans luteus]
MTTGTTESTPPSFAPQAFAPRSDVAWPGTTSAAGTQVATPPSFAPLSAEPSFMSTASAASGERESVDVWSTGTLQSGPVESTGRRGHGLWWLGVTATCAVLLGVGWTLGASVGATTNQETGASSAVQSTDGGQGGSSS